VVLRDTTVRRQTEARLVQANVELQREIAEHRRTEAALRQAKEMAEVATRAKSSFLANVSHELRTPLNAIIGYSEMLQEEAEDQRLDNFRADLHKIRTAGRYLLTLINELLDLAKIESGQMELRLETFDIADIIADLVATIRPLVETNANTLVVQTDASLGTMYSDPTRMRQVLFNLLSNACKFTKQGTIRLEVRRTAQSTGDWLTFRVCDSGIGMTPEQITRLFQEFTQADVSIAAQYGGTGLGLALSRQLCQLMAGHITIESIAGQGSTFVVQLPARATQPGQETTPDGRR
jgi:signal transduction histidine kinase